MSTISHKETGGWVLCHTTGMGALVMDRLWCTGDLAGSPHFVVGPCLGPELGYLEAPIGRLARLPAGWLGKLYHTTDNSLGWRGSVWKALLSTTNGGVLMSNLMPVLLHINPTTLHYSY